MTERDAVYVQILQFGLLQIRNSSALGHVKYCAVESEHLHNVPSLIGEANEERHRYYFLHERTQYIECADQSLPGVSFTMRRYEHLWVRLGILNENAQF